MRIDASAAIASSSGLRAIWSRIALPCPLGTLTTQRRTTTSSTRVDATPEHHAAASALTRAMLGRSARRPSKSESWG